jgi:hypothetical protein
MYLLLHDFDRDSQIINFSCFVWDGSNLLRHQFQRSIWNACGLAERRGKSPLTVVSGSCKFLCHPLKYLTHALHF